MGKDAWLHLPVKVMLYLARGWAVHMGSAPSGWPATLPSEARRKAQRAAPRGNTGRGAPITYEKGAHAHLQPPAWGPRTPGTSLRVSFLPWAGPDPTAGVPGRVRLQEPRLLAGHAWHGCSFLLPFSYSLGSISAVFANMLPQAQVS